MGWSGILGHALSSDIYVEPFGMFCYPAHICDCLCTVKDLSIKAHNHGPAQSKASWERFLAMSFEGTCCSLCHCGVAVPHVSVNNTHFPFPQQLSQLPKSTESEAGGWGGESYKEIRESLTGLGRSMGCFTKIDGRKLKKKQQISQPFSPTHTEQTMGGGGGKLLLLLLLWACHRRTAVCHIVVDASRLLRCCVVWTSELKFIPLFLPVRLTHCCFVCWVCRPSLDVKSERL